MSKRPLHRKLGVAKGYEKKYLETAAETLKDLELITASDGKLYRPSPRGGLVEHFDAAHHATRQLSLISAEHTITGLRIVNTSDPNGPAVVVTFDESEAKGVLDLVRAVLKARVR